MAANSITGRFRDIEVSFAYRGPRIIMSLENLAAAERQVRVMYQRRPISGRANWTDFQLSDEKQSAVMPRDVMEAYRLTFFVDKYNPISTPIEKILEELERLKDEFVLEERSPEPFTPMESKAEKLLDEARTDTTPNQQDAVVTENAAIATESEITPESTTQLGETAPPTISAEEASDDEDTPAAEKEVPQQTDLNRMEPGTSANVPVKPFRQLPESNFGFKISIPTLPKSAIAARHKAKVQRYVGTASKPRNTQKGILGKLGLVGGSKRNKVYYREEGERIQNEFQDRVAKLEKDYADGYGLTLENWDSDTLTQEETVVFLLNLMVNELSAWRKEAEKETVKNAELPEILTDIEDALRQTLKQTRGVSVPSPTLSAVNRIAENEHDLEKIRSECNTEIQEFSMKLAELDKSHAQKIELLTFKKFLVEFIRDILFLNVAKCVHPDPMPNRLNWFLEILDYELMPIEIGETQVSTRHHKLSGIKKSEFESGTIIEILRPGLQSKDSKQVIQTAVVIQSQ